MKANCAVRHGSLLTVCGYYLGMRGVLLYSRFTVSLSSHYHGPSISIDRNPNSTVRCTRRCIASDFVDNRRDYTSPTSLYQELGVDPNASPADIRRAFIKLAKQFHPDIMQRNQNEEIQGGEKPVQDLAEKFRKIRMAYGILSNETSRREYDWRARGIWRHSPTSVRRPSSSSTSDAEIPFANFPDRRKPPRASNPLGPITGDLKFEEPTRFKYTEEELEQMEAAEAARQLEFNILRQTRIRDLGRRREASRIKEYAAAREQYLARLVEVKTIEENDVDGLNLSFPWRIVLWLCRLFGRTIQAADSRKHTATSSVTGLPYGQLSSNGIHHYHSNATTRSTAPQHASSKLRGSSARNHYCNKPLQTSEQLIQRRPLYSGLSTTAVHGNVVQP